MSVQHGQVSGGFVTKRATFVLLVLFLLAAGPARARFASLDRPEVTGFKASLDLAVGAPIDGGEAFGLAEDVYLQFGGPGPGFYFVFPVSGVYGPGERETRIGNIEVGALFLSEWIGRNVNLVTRLGLALPTADGTASTQDIQCFTAIPRLTDASAAAVDALTLRSALSVEGEWEPFFFRADLGGDFSFPQTNGAWFGDAFGPRSGFAAFLRLNLAGGWQYDVFALTAEFVNVVVLREQAAGRKSVLSAATLAAHYVCEPLHFHLGLVVPLAKADAIDALGLSLGASFAF